MYYGHKRFRLTYRKHCTLSSLYRESNIFTGENDASFNFGCFSRIRDDRWSGYSSNVNSPSMFSRRGRRLSIFFLWYVQLRRVSYSSVLDSYKLKGPYLIENYYFTTLISIYIILNLLINSWVSAITGLISLVIMWPGIFYEFSVAQKEAEYLAKKAAGKQYSFGLILYI